MNIHAIAKQAQAQLIAGAPEQAEATLQPFLASGSGPILLWRLMAQALRQQGKFATLKNIQTMLVDMFPGELATRFDLAETLLSLGDYERGWREYQYRYSLPHTAKIERKVQRPRWVGEAIPGQVLLIHDEQGFGDTFQFIRFVHDAKLRSQAHVIVEVNHESYALAARSLPGFEVIRRGELPPLFDKHCALMSLPMALTLKLTDLPGKIPYLQPDAARMAYWQHRLKDVPRPLVAIAWAGRPTHPNDANRSISFEMLAPIVRCGAHFIAIQKGPAVAQAATLVGDEKFLVLSDEIQNFDDTSAIIYVSDLLVSVDSSPVHLAGALGRPAWVMLPYVADWRWLCNRNDTPWYPQHRLIRQPQRGNWEAVISVIANDLSAIVHL